MARIEMSESSYLKQQRDNEENEIGELYGEKGYTRIPIDQINLNTEPISIINNFRQSLLNDNIKSYIKVVFGFLVFIIVIVLISILSSYFHSEKIDYK